MNNRTAEKNRLKKTLFCLVFHWLNWQSHANCSKLKDKFIKEKRICLKIKPELVLYFATT